MKQFVRKFFSFLSFACALDAARVPFNRFAKLQ